jgi:exodeoxyribonuclease VII small subunit
MPKKKDDESLSLEDTLAALEQLVETLEQGDIPLEEAMAAFEKGVTLTRRAQQTLAAAEQKVQLLTEQDGEPLAQPFEEEDDD